MPGACRAVHRVSILARQACSAAPPCEEVYSREVSFQAAADGTILRGVLLEPIGVRRGGGRAPGVVLAAGFSSTLRMGPLAYAERFARAGHVALAYDHRGFGTSDGEPRQEVCFWSQLDGYRDAIDFLQAQPSVDPARIVVWGVSFSGGVALSVGAVDERVAAVLAVMPGLLGGVARTTPEQAALEAFRTAALGRAHLGAGLQKSIGPMPVVRDGQEASEGGSVWFGGGAPTADGGEEDEGVARDPARAFFLEGGRLDPTWVNQATWVVRRTGARAAAALPVHLLRRAAVHLVLATRDELVPPETVRGALAAVPSGRKALLEVESGHFEPLLPRDQDPRSPSEQILRAQIQFLRRHVGSER